MEQAVPFLQAIAEVSVGTRESAFWKGEKQMTTGGRAYLLGIAAKLTLDLPLTPQERQDAYFISNLENLEDANDLQRLVGTTFRTKFNRTCETCCKQTHGICHDVPGDNHGYATEVSPSFSCENYESKKSYYPPKLFPMATETGEGPCGGGCRTC